MVFIAMLLSGVSPLSPTVDQLISWGANYGPSVFDGQWWRLLTSTFVHIGIVHIALNMWCLWSLGILAEPLLGSGSYLWIYLLSGLAGSIVSVGWHPNIVGAGASGAIFGLAGTLISVLYFGKLPFPRERVRASLKSVVTFAAYNLFFGLKSGVDNAAHIGGLIGGLALGGILVSQITAKTEERQSRGYLFIAFALVLALGAGWVRQRNIYVVHLHQAQDALRRNDYDLALSQLREAEKSKQNDAYIDALIGYASEKKADFAEAERRLRKSDLENPRYEYPAFELGNIYLRTKRFEDARRQFDALTGKRPDSADAHDGLGSALEGLGRKEDAIREYQEAIRLDPKLASAHYHLGYAYLAEKRNEDAVSSLTEAARLEPNDPDTQLALAASYSSTGHKKEADAALERALLLKEQQSSHN